jgi:hypothetical protein
VTEMDDYKASIRHETNMQNATLQSLISGIGLCHSTSPAARPFFAMSGACKVVLLCGWKQGENMVTKMDALQSSIRHEINMPCRPPLCRASSRK